MTHTHTHPSLPYLEGLQIYIHFMFVYMYLLIFFDDVRCHSTENTLHFHSTLLAFYIFFSRLLLFCIGEHQTNTKVWFFFKRNRGFIINSINKLDGSELKIIINCQIVRSMSK